MCNLKKLFFLILLIGLISTPQAARAATGDITKITITPTSARAALGSQAIRFSLHTTNNAGADVAVTNGQDIIITLTPVKGSIKKVSKGTETELVDGTLGVAYFDILYTPPALEQAKQGDVISLKVDINDGAVLKATVTAPVTLVSGQAGDSCDPEIVDNCGVSSLKCDNDVKKCVPTAENRNIGTWCSKVQHCEKESGVLELTCNTDEQICVGAVLNVKCLNEDINNDPKFGTIASGLDSSERCDIGLFCDPNKGSCQNDFGQGKIPADKLGEAAEDIRDQIRDIINIALGFLGVAGVIVVIYGGIIWMTAFGEDEKVGKAKKTIIAGVIGLIIIGVAWTIVSYVLTVTQKIA